MKWISAMAELNEMQSDAVQFECPRCGAELVLAGQLPPSHGGARLTLICPVCLMVHDHSLSGRYWVPARQPGPSEYK